MLDSTFYINICAAVQSVNCSSQSVCQITENNNTIGCGSSSNWTFSCNYLIFSVEFQLKLN